MKEGIRDTPLKVHKMLIEGYRKMSPQQKLQQVNELTKTVQQFACARIRTKYGELSESELRLRLASLWLDREVMTKVFHWDPQEKGY
ncbi:hypothetical protein ACFL27_20510 [candidate division CSSED10-310 bacterium]|uniref:Uncharacterized protein n=1 Tax=candidate division CSSED10-310 bacterium TaxID=2855610 RepID=A0ABV6Z2A8_UNCC1